ncbi:DUF885 domain-containing protein [Ideonella sp. BN130291]|uniref:DUF885 domain-containing protein n=1 Tax=Ideonella sp. BN130291 TaxID=3112940 RepID=UPI002E25F10C|nr:DUF885 domain-containing protein [Ideonella sp. BN130291]
MLRRTSRSFILHGALALIVVPAAVQPALARQTAAPQPAQRLAEVADRYYEGYFGLFPMAATENLGEAQYEAAFEVDIAPAHRARQKALYERTLKALQGVDPRHFNRQQRVTYELLKYEAQQRLAMLAFPTHLLPLEHMNSMPVRLAQWASGTGPQPMKTAAHYEHYLARLKHLPAWIDQAMANMDEGIAKGIVQPRALIERLMPQLDALLPADPARSPYLLATREFPAGIAPEDQERLRAAYRNTVDQSIAPAIQRLRSYLHERYLPKCRDTAGLGALPGGAAWYRANVKDSTTTDLAPEQIHELGLKEVARIRGEMEKVKARFGFEGDLNAFFKSLDNRPELTPFHDEREVLDTFAKLNLRVAAALPKLFERAPKAALEIHAVEPMRRDTASDYYSPPATDGSRPGMFYTVVKDPATYRTTGMTSLFLHEGQPGHHYQMALQQELPVPKFRKGAWYDAYGEGWALYAEGLGREMGLYDDPNAYLGRLFMELHRALRLVVDTGLHAKGWSREQTIRYLMEMEGSKEDSARRATERYMAWPGQALAYKVGELKIIELREKARARLGERFDIRAFHSQVLGEGSMPLSMLEAKINAWIAAQGA